MGVRLFLLEPQVLGLSSFMLELFDKKTLKIMDRKIYSYNHELKDIYASFFSYRFIQSMTPSQIQYAIYHYRSIAKLSIESPWITIVCYNVSCFGTHTFMTIRVPIFDKELGDDFSITFNPRSN